MEPLSMGGFLSPPPRNICRINLPKQITLNSTLVRNAEKLDASTLFKESLSPYKIYSVKKGTVSSARLIQN